MNVTIIQEFQKLLIKLYSTGVWLQLKVKEIQKLLAKFYSTSAWVKLKVKRIPNDSHQLLIHCTRLQFNSPRIPEPSHQFPIYYTSVYVICMVQLCYEFQNILIDVIIHSTTVFNHPRIPKHLINFSYIPLVYVYGAKSQKN